MKSTAINTVYCIMHIFGENKEELEFNVRTKDGKIWYIYAREDEAKRKCKRLNEDAREESDDYLDTFIVVEKPLF